MLITYMGPEGSKFVGKTFKGVDLAHGKTDDIADLQRATGWKMSHLQAVTDEADIVGFQMLNFFTLRAGGHTVSWEQARSVALADVDIEPEPGDLPDDEGDDDADPQIAATDSPVAAAKLPRTKNAKSL